MTNHETTTQCVRRLSGLHNNRPTPAAPLPPVVFDYCKAHGWRSNDYTRWLTTETSKRDTKYLKQNDHSNVWLLVTGPMGKQTLRSLRTNSLYEAQQLRDSILTQKEAA